jgi:branched-chain amino acid transport system substrate-binding protein
MKRARLCFLMTVVFFTFLVNNHALADLKEYKVPVLGDFTGPFADVMKWWHPNRLAVINWWSDTEGKKLGLKLVSKSYDTRYDATVVASMWPGILAECQPLIALGLGGTDVAALQQRLSKDKVPVVYGTASYGYGWLPNQWIFNVRSTYTHEMLATLAWYINQHPGKRPVRVGLMSCQASPAFIDLVNGFTHYIKNVLEPKGLATIVAKEWIELQPVDVSSQMKKIIDARADIMTGLGTTTMGAAAIRAQQLHGVSIPTVASPHHTIWPLAQAMKSFKPWEGHYVVAGHISIVEKDSKAYEFYKLLQNKYGIKEDWSPISMMGLTQGILTVRAIEHAAKKVGTANLNGQAVYDALATGTFTEEELMGLMPTLHFTKDAPFPTTDLKVKIETVKDGKYTLATPGWVPVPSDITKW